MPMPTRRAEQWTAAGEVAGDRPEPARQISRLCSLGRVLVDLEKRAPHVAPYEVTGGAAEVLRLTPGDADAFRHEVANDLGDQSRLAAAGLGSDRDDSARTVEDIVERPCERRHLRVPADHRQRISDLTLRQATTQPDDVENSNRLGLALHHDVADELTLDAFAECSDAPLH